jgi:hypothetical protein
LKEEKIVKEQQKQQAILEERKILYTGFIEHEKEKDEGSELFLLLK